MNGSGGVFLRRASLALSLWASVVAGCDDSSGLAFVQPELETDPPPGALLAYAEVVLDGSQGGAGEARVVTIRNAGDASLRLQGAFLRAPDSESGAADQFRVSSYPERLRPGEEGELFVRFEPSLTGTTTADLVLRSNDADESEVTWPLQGPARDPCRLRAAPAHQAFELGETKPVTLRSASTHRCVVTSLVTDSNLFTVMDAPETPFVIEAGQSLEIGVRHSGTTTQPGVPVRQLRVREFEGTEAVVSFEGEEPLFGCLDIGPNRLSFGSLPIDRVGREEISVINRCNEPAMVVDANVSIGYSAYSVLGTFPRTVQPRERIELVVEYKPIREDGDGGRVTVLTNDAAIARKRIELYGNAARAILEVFPLRVDFGTVAYRNPQGSSLRSECASGGRVVQVFSTGESPVILSRVYIDELSDSLFQIASITVGGQPVDFRQPIRIPRNEEMRISMVFNPTRAQPELHQGRLVLEHNVGSGRTDIALEGRGGPDGMTEDAFSQLAGPKADILWVIDDSCSMFDEQARLISNLSQFVGYADSQAADYQMAVVTTDATSPNAGRFERCFPHPTIVSSAYADRDAAFRCMFDVGTNGIGLIEAGLGAAKKALERALDPDLDPNANANFLRDDANLVVVAVSDEDDQSFEPDRVLRDFFFSVKGRRNPERVRVHSIAYPTEEPCIPNTTFGSPGYGYAWMARETGGQFFNLCNRDWQPILRNLGIDVFTPLDEWELSRQADPATIQATVDGLPVRQDAMNGWTYDLNGNSIVFNGNARPAPGARIRVRYQGLCRP